MEERDLRQRRARPFPKWLGPAWLFLVYLEFFLDWKALFLYGAMPWFAAWGLWSLFERSELKRKLDELSSASVTRIWRWGARAIWVCCLVLIATTFYANHYMPKGPLTDTGDVVCMNDDRGPCQEKYIEDTRRLPIPWWAKFLKADYMFWLILGVVAAGVYASDKAKGRKATVDD